MSLENPSSRPSSLLEQSRLTSLSRGLQRSTIGASLLNGVTNVREWWSLGRTLVEDDSTPSSFVWTNADVIGFFDARDRVFRRELEVDYDARFDPRDYSKKRRLQTPWTTGEIGPGFSPSGLNRDFSFPSGFFAIENMSFPQYGGESEDHFRQLSVSRPDENIHLIVDESFGREEPGSNRYCLQDEIADEIFVCRTFDKPSWSLSDYGDQQDMTNEIERLLKPGGYVLIADLQRNIIGIARHLKAANLRVVYASWAKEGEWTTEEEFLTTPQGQIMRELGFGFCPPVLIIAKKPIQDLAQAANHQGTKPSEDN